MDAGTGTRAPARALLLCPCMCEPTCADLYSLQSIQLHTPTSALLLRQEPAHTAHTTLHANILHGPRSVLNTKLPPPKLSVAGGAAGLVKGIDSLGGGICSSFSFLRDRALSLHPASNGGDLGTPQASLNGTIAGLLGGTDSPMSVMSGRAHDRLGSWTQQSEHSGVGTSASSSMPASDHGALLQQSTEAQQKLRQMSVRELNDEIQELTFIGQGASGDVYRGARARMSLWHEVCVGHCVCMHAGWLHA